MDNKSFKLTAVFLIAMARTEWRVEHQSLRATNSPQHKSSNVVAGGIQNTGMPGFSAQLQTDQIEAVVAYVMTLKASPSDARAASTPVRSMPIEFEAGKALFFDSARMGGCGKCHELDQRGSAVAPALKIGSGPVDLRSVPANTFTAQPSGEDPFPVIVIERSDTRIRVFDLSSPLPVLRSFKPDQIKLTPGSHWQHREALSGYNEGELRSIEAYARWASKDK